MSFPELLHLAARIYYLRVLACLTLVGLLTFPSREITLDPTFGTGGRVVISFSVDNFTSGSGTGIFVQPSGRVLARSGGSCLFLGPHFPTAGYGFTGLAADGSVDTTFGAMGRTTACAAGFVSQVAAAEMLSDAQYLVLGNSTFHTLLTGSPFLSRRTRDGSIDPSFSANIRINENSVASLMSVRSDEKVTVIVASGFTRHVIRVNPNGSRDKTFGTNGVLELSKRLNNVTLVDMRSTVEGKTLLIGRDGTVARLNNDGYLDGSFGMQGIARLYYLGGSLNVTKSILQHDGKIILLGYVTNADNDVFLARLSRRGKPDSSFGNGGIVITDFAESGDDRAADGILAKNKILVAGKKLDTFLIAKYSIRGTLEAHTTVAFPELSTSSATGIALQPDRKIVVIGGPSGFGPPSTGVARLIDDAGSE